MIQDIYEFVVQNKGIHYFASDPKRLLHVILLSLAGGLIALGISRLSTNSRRRLKLVALGIFGALLTGGLGFFAFVIASIKTMERETEIFWWVIVGLLGMGVAAGLVWLEFRQVWRES
jgi:hypothetical protein